ncbi:alanine/glycine:cation symporter family protein [Brevibacterium senegalense]|uniref:alanine/glycine:cation symporter family protein n=1 Tax=Brevibacterium senegalense TaxID=1033736 RepID=UPI000309D50A|nr:alanine/glycine:cation symporter family protein [Brevibacterium senegalense]
MTAFVDWLNGVVWAPPLVYLCLAAGVFFTIRTRVVQIRQIPAIAKQMFTGTKSDDGVSSFQALTMSLAGRVGTGNIAGVATAIAFGGPGAVLWMWISALLGASTSFVESTLGQIYKEKDKDTGEYRGGPAYYFERAYAHTKAKGLFKVYATAFAVVTVFSMSFMLPGVQANGMTNAMENAWSLPPWVVALAIVIALGFIIVGGVKRIATFAGYVVPFMAVLYILGAIIVAIVNIDQLGEVVSLVVSSAFTTQSAVGAMVGAAVEWGVKRGIYSNEAGQGTGPHAAAAAEVSHPAKQGLVQAGSVYIDTIFVCTATAFMILSTGMYKVFPGGDETAAPVHEGGGRLSESAVVGPAYAQAGFDTVLPGFGASFVAISLAFFAFTTIVAYYYMAETNLKYLLRGVSDRRVSAVLVRFLQLFILVACAYGAVTTAGSAWALGDIGVGLMAWFNIVGILLIQQPVFKVLRDYERQVKEGKDPDFDPRVAGIQGAVFWEQRADGRVADGPEPEPAAVRG